MLTKVYREAAEKIPEKLAANPFIGNPLSYPFLREKRIREKRVYFLVYDDLQAVLIVAIGGKKDQQASINHIVNYFDEYRLYLERLLKN